MKFLHTSDWHLGMTYKNNLSYADDQRFVINEIAQIAIREKVDGILLAGDVFDKSIASTEAIKLYDEITTHICLELGIPIYLIAGNHDGADRISQCNGLLKESGLFIAGSIKKEPLVINRGDVDIYLLPWFSTDKVKTLFPENEDEIDSMESAYKYILDIYRQNFVPGHKNILLSHAFIVDAETSVSDRAAEIGKATMVGSYVFDGFDYVALGHLHGPQQISEKIRYSGTPMAYSFGKEEKQEKSVTIIDTDSGEQKIVPLPQLHKRITLSGTYGKLLEAEYDKDILDAYVRLEIEDAYVGADTWDTFGSKFKNLIDISGKNYESENAKVTMSLEEFESDETTPEIVFENFCKDILAQDVDEHKMDLFKEAMEDCLKEGDF